MASEWTDELKAEVIKAYKDKNPTPQNSIELITELSKEFDKTVNGIRMILIRAGEYIKKEETKPSGKSESTVKRVSKADSIKSLKDIISSQGAEINDEVIDKLTGKAAVYFYSVIESIIKEEDSD